MQLCVTWFFLVFQNSGGIYSQLYPEAKML
jgi:hypothetical protein